MLKHNPHVRRLLALAWGSCFLSIEILFRALRDCCWVKRPTKTDSGRGGWPNQGELIQQSTLTLSPITTTIRFKPHPSIDRVGDGFPASGSMRQVRFDSVPSKPRYFLLGGSGTGSKSVNLKIDRTETVPLGKQVRALDEPLSISGQTRLALAKRKCRGHQCGDDRPRLRGVRRIALETLRYSPKALLLYMGNNEGIGLSFGMQGEELPIVPEVQISCMSCAAFDSSRIGYNPCGSALNSPPLKGTKPEVLGVYANPVAAAGEALMSTEGPTDSVYQALLNRFEYNLRVIVKAAQTQDTQVVIIPTAPHLGYPPFYDANNPALLESEIQNYTQLLGTAKQQLTLKNWKLAEQTIRSAIEIDQTHATAWFWLAQSLDGQGRYPEMLNAAHQALLLDISRKRSLPDYAKVAKTVCDELGCIAGDAMPSLEQSSEKGLSVYDKLYGDHEHLTPEGCAWIGQLFAEQLSGTP